MLNCLPSQLNCFPSQSKPQRSGSEWPTAFGLHSDRDDKISVFIVNEQDQVGDLLPDSSQSTKNPLKSDVPNHVIPMKCAVDIIVIGYNRRFRISIPEIDNLCIAYYGWTRELIHFKEHGNWFSNIIVDHPMSKNVATSGPLKGALKLNLHPLTQYIVENVQFAYGHIVDSYRKSEWSGFLCIDLKTRSFRKLKAEIKSVPIGRKRSKASRLDKKYLSKLTVSLYVHLGSQMMTFKH